MFPLRSCRLSDRTTATLTRAAQLTLSAQSTRAPYTLARTVAPSLTLAHRLPFGWSTPIRHMAASHRPAQHTDSAVTRHTASVIFLHGSGGGGKEFYQTFSKYYKDSLPHVNWVCPEADARPYTLLDGQSTQVWFDRATLDLDCPEDPTGIERSVKLVEALVAGEVEKGVPRDRIVIGGFSQGGCLAYYVCFGRTNLTPYAACITAGSFLPEPSRLFIDPPSEQPATSIADHLTHTPVLMLHGTDDLTVPFEPHSVSTYTRLKSRLPNVSHVPIARLDHRIDLRVLRQIKELLAKVVPPI